MKGFAGSRVIGSPDPPLPYKVENFFPDFSIQNLISFKFEPGTGRVFALRRDGVVMAGFPLGGPPPVEIARLPESIRGYDLVIEQQHADAAAKQVELLDAFRRRSATSAA